MRLTINSYELQQVLKVVAGFTAHENTRNPIFELVNVVNEDGQVYFYATDTYRAVKYHISKCEFKDLTNFKIDPKVILNLLSLYVQPYSYVDVTFHTEIAENIYFIDIGKTKDIPLPKVMEENYPNVSKLFAFELEKEDLVLGFDVLHLFRTLQQFIKADCTKVKLIRCIDNKNIIILGDNNKNLETIIVPTKF